MAEHGQRLQTGGKRRNEAVKDSSAGSRIKHNVVHCYSSGVYESITYFVAVSRRAESPDWRGMSGG